MEQNIQRLWDNYKRHTKKERKTELIFEAIMIKNFF